MENKNDFFTFLGKRYSGTWQDAFKMYQQSNAKTFTEYLQNHKNEIK
jgi:hypothetical protein